ncbi:MAG: hypothetical protein KAX11_10280 [Candidatus Aminicenantes bacterium]|nr:hypothetical protein [Candidatus Aminicenantes bacterium]
MKKKWTQPQLIELYRGRFEENVLCFCKSTSQGGRYGGNCKCGSNKCSYIVSS